MTSLNLLTPNKNRPNSNVSEIYKRASNKNIYIPLYENKVSAGFPSPAADHVETRLSTDDYLIKNPTATYFVKVKGDSMIDAKIFDGDVLIVDRSIDPSVGKIILAEVNGEFTVKYLGKQKLIPANPMYKEINFDESESITVIGVVTGSMRKFL